MASPRNRAISSRLTASNGPRESFVRARVESRASARDRPTPRGRGNPSPDSDVDLLVVVPASQSPPAQRAMRAHRVLPGLGIPKDVLVRTRDEIEHYRLVPASLEAQILERGRPLYG